MWSKSVPRKRGDEITASSISGLIAGACATGVFIFGVVVVARSTPKTVAGLSRNAALLATAGLLAALAALVAVASLADLPLYGYAGWVLLVAAAALDLHVLSLRSKTVLDDRASTDDAAVDALTHLATHRVFQDRLNHECDRAYRFGDTFMVMMLDLDSFHQTNDHNGHHVGDKILVGLAQRLRSQLREIDLIARFGPDQFAMILPHTYKSGGNDVGERLRKDIAAWCFLAPKSTVVRTTASLGLCSYPEDGTTPSELVEGALTALRFAKAMGGNQVQLTSELPSKGADNVIQLPHTGRGAIVRSLAAAVDVRDGYTREHSHMVSELSVAIAKAMNLPDKDIDRISVAALLHDVGKIGVPDAILTKEGNLTNEEWMSIRQHPVLGRQIIEQAPELTDVMPLVLYHQEHFDGSGYPECLCGEEIPLGARIIAAADAYHAIRSNRPYRLGRTHAEATRELARCSGKQFDPRIVEALFTVLDGNEMLQAMAGSDPYPRAVRSNLATAN